MNKFGIMQGRLTKSPKNKLQFFPKNYLYEFLKAREVKLDFIEFITEEKKKNSNPIWSKKKIEEYKFEAKKNNLKIINFLDNFIINNDFRNLKTQEYLKKLIDQIKYLGAKNLILPFYNKSYMNDNNHKSFVENMNILLKYSHKKKINILIESDINFETFKIFKKNFTKDIFFVYDIGNRSCVSNHSLLEIKKFKKFIKLVHVKDKNLEGKNVPLGSGISKVDEKIKFLKKLKYKGNFTFETTRGSSPLKTAKKNLNHLRKIFFK